MAEDHEPRLPGAGEADHLAAYLDYHREGVVVAVLGLDEAQRRATPLASGWSPVELLSHLLHMERRWILGDVLGEHVDDYWGDWSTSRPWHPDSDPDARWVVSPQVTAEDLADRLRALGRRTTLALASTELDRPCPRPEADAEPRTLRSVAFHLLEEYARHHGQLDAAVELLSVPDRAPNRHTRA